MRIFASLSIAVLALATFAGQSQTAVGQNASAQVALTPPMGWNSWNFFAGKVSDKDIRAAADQLVATGMKDAGYVYVNIDDTWEGERDANGVLHTNSKFPDMKALADYVHSKGLKIGIYSSPGPKTCAGFEASYNHEEQDAKLYAEWGIDYLKYDACSFIEQVMEKQAPNDKAEQMRMMRAAYAKMDKALKATGRPIVYSFCQYGMDAVWEWGPSAGGNLWRTTGDISPHWDRMYVILNEQAGLEKYAGPGHWNDPDMLEVGNGKLTLAENRLHFSMWAMLAAPLLAGNDLPNMKPEIKAILTNPDVIAIDQTATRSGQVLHSGDVIAWTADLPADFPGGYTTALALFNLGETPMVVSSSFEAYNLEPAVYRIRDPWTGKNQTKVKSVENLTLEPHASALWLLKK